MGTWRLESIIGNVERRAGNICGHDVVVTLQMRFTPGFFGRFKETPELDWYERITVLEHHKGEFWKFEVNQYYRKPTSTTMEPWGRRYVDAYRHAMGPGFFTESNPPKTTLLDVRGVPVERGDLPPDLKDAVRQRDAVRNYLRQRGGILEITIHDVPAINKPEHAHTRIRRERLLEFNVGVVGNPTYRWRGAQYLLFDNTSGSIHQTLDFRPSMLPLRTDGLRPGPPNPSAVNFVERVYIGNEAVGYVL